MARAIVVVRHAQRLDAVDPDWYTTSPCPFDPPLSRTGVAQARETAQEIAAAVQRLKAGASGYIEVVIYTSPFLRCVQTAIPIAEAVQAQVRVSSVLGEWQNPDFFHHGAPPQDDFMSLAKSSYNWVLLNAKEAIPYVDFSYDINAMGRPNGYGETWTQMDDRAMGALSRVLAASAAGGIVILVTHSSLCSSILLQLRESTKVERLDYASWTMVEAT